MDDLNEPMSGSREPGSRPPEASPPREVAVRARPAKPARGPLLGDWLSSCAAAQPFQPLARLVAGKTPPLLWGVSAACATGALDFLLAVNQAIRTQRAKPGSQDMLNAAQRLSSPDARDENDFAHLSEQDAALQCVALAYVAPLVTRSDGDGTAELLLPLLLAQLETSRQAPLQSPLAQILLDVELPLVLAQYAPDRRTGQSLCKSALAAEARLAATALDQQGLPQGGRTELLRPMVASLVRAHELLRSSEQQFSAEARDRLARLARNVLRLTRPDGSSVLSSLPGAAADREFLAALMLLNESARPLAALALGKLNKPPEGKLPKGTPAAPMYSAGSSLAILRTRWAAPAVQTTVDFSRERTWLEISSGNQSLVQGQWDVQVKANGTELKPLGSWSEVCWFSDADCDYLEIEQKLAGGWLLQRHLLLVRRDQCLLLADSLLSEMKQTPAEFLATASQSPKLEYQSNLPLSPGVAFAPQAETREGQLRFKNQWQAHVLPIALPEWRKQPAAGELLAQGNSLQLSLRATGRNLFAPLWIDLHPGRRKSPLTWRQLTIGESLAVQPREVAVGYRVQVHSMQWLLYRSLAWRGNRTVLGKNFATDLACCRFLPNGETEEILEVQ